MKRQELTISVHNPTNLERTHETIELDPSQFKSLIDEHGYSNLGIFNKETGDLLLNQWIDENGNGQQDQWIFQADFNPNAKLEFVVRPLEKGEKQPQSQKSTYSRFVPERTDDYAWENDRVAFRTFGPDAQQRAENKKPGGTLTSGIDLWLKRVDYPIINKWYKNNEEKKGAYHIDSGEGYDPYHVGVSRGAGGIGFWLNDSLYTSKNFASYETISEGPIRTVFKLKYKPWDVNGQKVTEEKKVTLDLGSNLCHFQSTFSSASALPSVGIGITLHDKKGKTFMAEKEGVFSYWEEIDEDHLGVGIVLPKEHVQKAFERKVDHKDASHLMVLSKPNLSELSYYVGYGWERSKQFTSEKEWNDYLAFYAEKIQTPLVVEVYN
ncbi:DUF4861 domain-containing protein [Flammeovirga aprica]|uniref:DUF4861 domain-containing protein n=1 Tax=Flammeovirga aprica JL-4 TaxID=694437 RepID=A0A7X9NZF9_9BACT|nr:DUF4861 domain-containing protein [Flammeovirga aprica]NME66776.1 DUF4861 domain-containing protein [Flammeovirga aprica JL-4]